MEAIIIVTVWTVILASNGHAASETISHERAFVGLPAAGDYIATLDGKCRAELRSMTPAELLTTYTEVVRNARTAGLVVGGVVTDRTSTYTVPDGAMAAASTFKRLASACEGMMAGCKARARRAELESVHDRARRIGSLLSDLSCS